MKIKSANQFVSTADNIVIIVSKNGSKNLVPEKYRELITPEILKKIAARENIHLACGEKKLNIFPLNPKEKPHRAIEKARRFAAKCAMHENNNAQFTIITEKDTDENFLSELCIALGISLYKFQPFKTTLKKKYEPVIHAPLSIEKIRKIKHIVHCVNLCRDWVNMPANYLNAPRLAEEFKKLEKKAPLKVTVLNKKEIQKLKMGGLLAVNQGSVDEPRFSIMEYKPKNPRNKRPIVLVGKGLVYDTGGLSLKPTPGSMDSMKCDMAGGAVVAAAVYAVALLRLPCHVIALIPSTDNRPGFNAFAPGDVITMMNGSTVEMLNSDAEGRMILADALHYAKRYNPAVVLEFSTLTGAAANAIGIYGMVGMGILPAEIKSKIMNASEKTGERIAEFPFWDDYDELLKSDIADFKNIGGPVAGAITAGRFLKKFTQYPFYHFDIAAPAFIQNRFHYMPKGGTGFGVRFLIDFIENY